MSKAAEYKDILSAYQPGSGQTITFNNVRYLPLFYTPASGSTLSNNLYAVNPLTNEVVSFYEYNGKFNYGTVEDWPVINQEMQRENVRFFNAPDQITPGATEYNKNFLDSYKENFRDQWAPGSNTGFSGFSFGGGGGGGSASNAGYNSVSDYFKAVPEAQSFLRWYYPYIQDIMQKVPQATPFDLSVPTSEAETRLLGLQEQRVAQAPGLYEAYKPALERQHKVAMREATDRLESLGLGGSSPGLSQLGEMEEEYGAQVAQLPLLGYQEQGTQMAGLWDMLQRPEQRAYENLKLQYSDWLRQTGQPAEYASALGTPTSSSLLSGMTGAYTSGMSAAATLGAASKAASASKYATDVGYMQSMQEMEYMAPYLAQANQAIPTSGGKK